MDYGPKRLDYSSMQEWLDAGKKWELDKRMGNVPAWAVREGAAPIMTGHEYDEKVSDAVTDLAGPLAHDTAYRDMFPRSNYDDARQDLTDANLKTMGAFDKAQADLSNILGTVRSEAASVGERERARYGQDEEQTGFRLMGGTPGAERQGLDALNRASSQYAQQMMPVHFGRAKAHDAHGQQLANLSSRQADMDNAYTEHLTNLYYQQQQWKDKLDLEKLSRMTPKQRDLYNQSKWNKQKADALRHR